MIVGAVTVGTFCNNLTVGGGVGAEDDIEGAYVSGADSDGEGCARSGGEGGGGGSGIDSFFGDSGNGCVVAAGDDGSGLYKA